MIKLKNSLTMKRKKKMKRTKKRMYHNPALALMTKVVEVAHLMTVDEVLHAVV